ncbi:DUF2528 family protein [Pseudomonas fluorescens]|nr:DUF2528 family protein [Pseudomonas fluorescens]
MIKQYTVKESWKDLEVTLEVDLRVLTENRATMINQFWSEDDDRLEAEDGDVVKAVIGLTGSTLSIPFLEGGASFSDDTKNLLGTSVGDYVSTSFHNEEGWGETILGSPYGWCGIRVIAADVETPSFDDVELVEVSYEG